MDWPNMLRGGALWLVTWYDLNGSALVVGVLDFRFHCSLHSSQANLQLFSYLWFKVWGEVDNNGITEQIQ